MVTFEVLSGCSALLPRQVYSYGPMSIERLSKDFLNAATERDGSNLPVNASFPGGAFVRLPLLPGPSSPLPSMKLRLGTTLDQGVFVRPC